MKFLLLMLCWTVTSAAWADARNDALPAGPASASGSVNSLPQLVGAQYTFIEQSQSRLTSPYAGPLSLNPAGDSQPTHTLGAYFGWAPHDDAQLYLDVEKFMGAGVSNATGLAGLTNGDVVREGASGLKKDFYIARAFVRLMWPLTGETSDVERDQDQIAGREPVRRLELKAGRLAVTDDFDQNRYAGSARTQFLNWSLWANTAWDYPANTRGYSDGIVLGYITDAWSLKYGVYKMPEFANQQTLESHVALAHGQNVELTLRSLPGGAVVRLMAYLNTARMGSYDEALALAMRSGTAPDIVADDREGRQKHGFGINLEQPLADEGDTGMFLRWGWNDGQNETFAFTEVDSQLSAGAQLAGRRWGRAADRLGVAMVSESLSEPHQRYLAAGGCGFLLCDGGLSYGHEQILEAYYRLEYVWPQRMGPIRWQLSPDLQYVRNPGYNTVRGPVRFWAARLHLEY
jgi:hypothetical protein